MFSRNTFRKIAPLLFAALVFQGALFTHPQKAEAGLASGSSVIVLQNIVTDLKEWVADGALGWAIVNTMIAAMGDSMIQWINSGFQGDPLFVSNPDAFFADVANEVSGQFINEINASAICEPYRPLITVALAQQPTFLDRSQCTFLDAAANVEDFINDFENGGWAGWLSLTQHPQNNPYGAYFIALDEHTSRLIQREQDTREELNQNQGFLSLKRCVVRESTAPQRGEVEAGSGNVDPYPRILTGDEEPEGSCLRWETQTPGQAVVSSLNESIGAPLDRLGQADEITEAVLSAIMDALINQTIRGGLRSLSDSDAESGENLYVDSTTQERDRLMNQIDQAIAENERVLGISPKAETLKEMYSELHACYQEQKETIRNERFHPTPEVHVPPINVIEEKQKEIVASSRELDRATRTGAEAEKAAENIERLTALKEDIIRTEEAQGRLSIQDVRDFTVRFNNIRREVGLRGRAKDLHDLERADEEIEVVETEIEQCKQKLEVLQGELRDEPVPTPVNCVGGCIEEGSEEESSEGESGGGGQ